jgi:hypothetical protein
METLTDKAKSTSLFKSVSIPPPSVRMVQAKTENGNWRTVPLYEASMVVCYRNDNEIQECKILTVHHDDLLEPYYTVRLLDRKEKQTDNTHIILRLQDGKKCNEEGMTHQDIAREARAKRAFILQKQRMKKGKRTIKKKYWESLPPEKKAQFLEDEAVAHQKYWESLPLKNKAWILKDNAAAHQKYRESLPLEKKVQILEDDAAAHQKYRESLPPEKKARILEDDAAAHQKYQCRYRFSGKPISTYMSLTLARLCGERG